MAFIVAGLAALLALFIGIREREWAMFVFGVLGLLLGALAGVAIDAPVNYAFRSTVDESYNMVALNDGTETHGHFFLGSGTIDSVPSFMFYAESNGGFVLRSWSADSSTVVETEGSPKAVYHCDDYSHVWAPFRWSAKMITDDGSYIDCRHASVTFYVPPGSVKQQYNLDAQ